MSTILQNLKNFFAISIQFSLNHGALFQLPQSALLPCAELIGLKRLFLQKFVGYVKISKYST